MSGQRDIQGEVAEGGAPASEGRNLIVVIGIDRYRDTLRWQRLSNAVSDARGVAALFDRLGFAPARPELIDDAATGQAIQSLVTDDLTTLGSDDSLVLFYAGHGGNQKRRIGDRDITIGYLIPVDAEGERVSTWVNLEAWLKDVALLPPKHILVILDACHSGIALDPVIKWRDRTSWHDEPLATLKARRSRRIITSALGDQRAMDGGPYSGHSLFTGCLIEALTHGLRRTDDPVMTGAELGLHLQRRVGSYPHSRQTPDFGTFAFDDRGEMVISFELVHRPRLRRASTTVVEPTTKDVSTLIYPETRAEPTHVTCTEPETTKRERPRKATPPPPPAKAAPPSSPPAKAAPPSSPSGKTVPPAPPPSGKAATPPPLPSSASQVAGMRRVTGGRVAREVKEHAPWDAETRHDRHGLWAAFEVNGVQQRMRWIPPGRFLMGSPETELGRFPNEGPQHPVILTRGFWLGETPVTLALWVAVMGQKPSQSRSYQSHELKQPVEFVSWDDCQTFFDRLDAHIPGLAATLPTEAQWERACRAGTTTATWVGDLSEELHAPELDAIAWYANNSDGQTHPVGGKAPNPYGFHDMLGNVYEWCLDAAEHSGKLPRYAAGSVKNPVAVGQGSYRVCRGGSRSGSACVTRAAYRLANPQGSRFMNLGFRLAGGQG